MAILPPKIDRRDQQAIVGQLRELISQYCQSEWQDAEAVKRDRQTEALSFIFAKMMENIIQRLNKVPDKNLLSFLDMVEVQLLPPRVARAPLVFTMAQGASQFGFIPAGVQVAAAPAKNQEAVVFETEQAITVILPKLIKAVSINPPDDKWWDHSPVFFNTASKDTEDLFQGKTLIPHYLYLGHKKLLGLKGQATVKLQVKLREELAHLDREKWEVKWYCYTDGKPTPLTAAGMDTGRKNNNDVVNLLKNGSIIFPNISGISEQMITDPAPDQAAGQPEGWKSNWIFAELNTPISNVAGGKLPEIETIKVSIEEIVAPAGGVGTIASNGINVQGNKTTFAEKLNPQDLLIANNQTRKIKSVISNTILTVDSAFDPLLPEGTVFIYLLSVGTGEITVTDDKTILSIPDPTKTMEEGYVITAANQFRRIEKVTVNKETNTINLLLESAFDGDLPGDTIFYCIPSVAPAPDIAFFNNFPLDLTKDFLPFGERPKLSDTFYIGAKEVFSKKGATVTVAVELSAPPVNAPADERDVTLYWEYWNGKNWAGLGQAGYHHNSQAEAAGTAVITPPNPNNFSDTTMAFTNEGLITFKCPQIELTKVNGEENYWVRARIAGGGYGKEAGYKKTTVNGTTAWDYEAPTFRPPSLSNLTLSYQPAPVEEYPEVVLTYNDFNYQDQTNQVLTDGQVFKPFQPVAESEPAFYLAFDRDISTLPVTLFFPLMGNIYNTRNMLAFDNYGPALDETSVKLKNILNLKVGDMIEFQNTGNETEQKTLTGIDAATNTISWEGKTAKNFSGKGSTIVLLSVPPVIAWEYWNGMNWVILNAEDKTNNFSRMEMVQFYAPNDLTGRYLFGETHYWIRARLAKGGYTIFPKLGAIFTNTVWAHNLATIDNEILGSSDGQPGQVFKFSSSPVLPGQVVLVREIALTEAEKQAIQDKEGSDAISAVPDQDGNIVELWVRWQEVKNFNSSQADNRHYTIDRIKGTITFGDAARGMIPPAGKDNIKCGRYQSGGGSKGNVNAGTITQLRTTYPYIDAVTNPEAADGGCEQEDLDRAMIRGPHTIKHRDRAVTCEDFEWLVREASLKITKVKCLPTTEPFFEYRPGYITVILVPESDDPKPLPSRELIQEIEDYIFTRTSTHLTIDPARINLVGPSYIRVGISATVKYTSLSMAKIVESRIIDNLKRFFHPLRGGVDRQGWDFGRNVYISEVYQLIEATEGVDYVINLTMKAPVQLYTLILKSGITLDRLYTKSSMVSTTDRRISLKLAEDLPASKSDEPPVNRLNVMGFKEDDRIKLGGTIDLVIKSVYHSKEANNDILEFEPFYTDRDLPINSIVETIDQRTRSYILTPITKDSEVQSLTIAVFAANDPIILISKDDPADTESGTVTEINQQLETVYIEDNYLVYSGTHNIYSEMDVTTKE
jgi:hypothetical protein